MLHAMKFFRNFVLITMLVNGSFVLASGLFPNFKLDSNKSSELVNRTPALLHRLNLSHLKFDWFKNISIEPCTTFVIDNTTFVINRAMNNPKMSGAMMGICVLFALIYTAPKWMSPEKWKIINSFFTSKIDVITTKLYGWLPTTVKEKIWIVKLPLGLLGNAMSGLGGFGLSGAAFLGSSFLGYTKISAVALIACCFCTHQNITAKMDANQAENNKNFNEVKGKIDNVLNDIAKLNIDLTNQIQGVGGKVDNLDVNLTTQIKKVSDQIGCLEKELKAISDKSDKNKEEIKKQINRVKQSFTKTLDSNLEAWANKLMKRITESEANLEAKRDQDSKLLDEQLEGIDKDLAGLAEAVKVLNNNVTEQNEQILKKMSAGEQAFEDLKQILLEKIREGLEATKAESEKLVKKTDNIEENQKALQDSVDKIQNQQNRCVDVLNVLQKSNVIQETKIDDLVKLVNNNQKKLDKKFEEVDITSTVQVEEINKRLDKIQSEVAANKKEILENIGVLGNKINKLDLGIQLIDTTIEKTLSENIRKIQKECKFLDESINNYTKKNLQDKEELSLKMAQVYTDIDTKLKALVVLNSRVTTLENDNKKFLELLKQYQEENSKNQEENRKHQEENRKYQEENRKLIEKQGKETNANIDSLRSEVQQVAQQGGQTLLAIKNELQKNNERRDYSVADSRRNNKKKKSPELPNKNKKEQIQDCVKFKIQDHASTQQIEYMFASDSKKKSSELDS